MVHRDLQKGRSQSSSGSSCLVTTPDWGHPFLNPPVRAGLASSDKTVVGGGGRTLSVFLPVSPGFPGRYADSADKERAGLRQVSLHSESLSSETAAGSQDPLPRPLPSPGLCNKGEALCRRTLWFGWGPGGRSGRGRGEEGGGPSYFWCKVRTAPRFPQPGGWVPSLGACTPRSLGSP